MMTGLKDTDIPVVPRLAIDFVSCVMLVLVFCFIANNSLLFMI